MQSERTSAPIDGRRFLDSVQLRGALPDADAATRTAESTLAVLGELLVERDRLTLAGHLPAPWRDALQRNEAGQDFDLETFYARVAGALGIRYGLAVEHAQAVCAALAAQLDGETLTWLRLRLPDGFAGVLAQRTEPPPPPAPHPAEHAPGTGRTLADGRPGPSNPISSADARGQRHSIACTDEPHADTRLSTAQGITQERNQETIASGRPRRRPVNEAD